MKFLISKSIDNSYGINVRIGKYVLNYSLGNNVSGREFAKNDDDMLIIADTNISFHKHIFDCNDVRSLTVACLNYLTNGFVIFADMQKERITLINDCYGFFSVFVDSSEKHGYRASSTFKKLISSDFELDLMAVLDIILFNYTLLDRTLAKNVKRLQKCTMLSYTKEGFMKQDMQNFTSQYIRSTRLARADPAQYAQSIASSINNNIKHDAKTILTLTGGFDSRVLLAILLELQIPFSTITFGQQGNIDQIIAKNITNDLGIEHEFYKLDRHFENDLERLTHDYIKLSLNNPVIQDITHYLAMKKIFVGKNLITGFMGGENLSGQHVGAQATYTEAAEVLLNTSDIGDLSEYINKQINKLKILDVNLFHSHLEEYAESLCPYFQEESNQNVARFLWYEKYAKFFGAINNIYNDKVNLIVPNMSVQFLSYIMSTENNFMTIKKTRGLRRTLCRINNKRIQAKAICLMAPQLKHSKFDRLYSVNDINSPTGLPKTALGYFRSHVLKSNKNNYPRPHEYESWYINHFIEKINNNDFSDIMLMKHKIPNREQLESSPSTYKRKLMNIMACLWSLSIIQNETLND